MKTVLNICLLARLNRVLQAGVPVVVATYTLHLVVDENVYFVRSFIGIHVLLFRAVPPGASLCKSFPLLNVSSR